MQIAPPTHHERVAQRQDRTRLSARARRDAGLKPEVARVFGENFAVYGVRKVWRQMMRNWLDLVSKWAEISFPTKYDMLQ